MSQNAVQSSQPFLHLNSGNAQHGHVSLLEKDDRRYPVFINPVNRLEYKDKVHYTFAISERFANHFILIRGLIDFHRPLEIQFGFDREQRSFEVKTTHQHVDFLFQFLQKVQDWLVQEIQFKTALKKIIHFENHYNTERASIYKSLLGI